jgi:hypothetical protein
VSGAPSPFDKSLPASSEASDSQQWTITWLRGTTDKPPFWCEVRFYKSVDITTPHVGDTATQQGYSAYQVDSVWFWRDTDGDGIPDDGGGSTVGDGPSGNANDDPCDTGKSTHCDDNCQDNPNADQKDTDNDGKGDICDQTPSHEVTVKHCYKFGPAPANMSDTAQPGAPRYMWAICEIGNFESYPVGVDISMNITGTPDPLPAACTQDGPNLILPGQSTFVLQGKEQKWVLYRTSWACSMYATPGIYNLNVQFCSQAWPMDGMGSGELACHQQVRQLIVHNP